MCAPESTVSESAAAFAIGYQRSGFSHTAGLAARCISVDMNCALVDHPVEVGAWGGTGTHIAERVGAVQLLAARRKVDTGERVGDRLRRTHRHPADGVDEPCESVELDLGVVVEAQPGRLLDGLGQQRRTADGERRVDLVGAVVRDLHIRVPRDGNHRGRGIRPQGGHVHKHDRVGVPVADVAAGAEFGLLLGGESLPAVGADKQPCGALALGRPVGVVGQRGDAVQRGVDPERRAEYTGDGQDHHRQQRRDDATHAALGLGGSGWRRRLAHNRIRLADRTAAVAAGSAVEAAESADWAATAAVVGSGRA